MFCATASACVLEALTTQLDNLQLPLHLLAGMLMCGVRAGAVTMIQHATASED